jgi:hypothetical protein
MATKYPVTGTTDFNLNLNDLVEEAFERCGKELRSGYDLRTARRSLNMLSIEWSNRGINMWTIDTGQITLTYNVPSYPLPLDTIDLLDHVVRTGTGQNQQDINITRISESTYLMIPNKFATGRPIQLWISRQSGGVNATATTTVTSAVASTDTTITVASVVGLPSVGYINIDNETIGYTNLSGNVLQNCVRGANNTTAASHSVGANVYINYLPNITVWPCPDASNSYTFVYTRLRRIKDAGNGINGQDIPFRFIPAMVAGLAYYLAIKLPDMDPQRVMGLKADYEQQFQLAADEDREKAAVRFVPRETFIQ